MPFLFAPSFRGHLLPSHPIPPLSHQALVHLLSTINIDHNVVCKHYRPQRLLPDLICQLIKSYLTECSVYSVFLLTLTTEIKVNLGSASKKLQKMPRWDLVWLLSTWKCF